MILEKTAKWMKGFHSKTIEIEPTLDMDILEYHKLCWISPSFNSESLLCDYA
jgi:hypothetical protein